MEIHRGAFLGSHWCVLKTAGGLPHFLEGCLCEIRPSSRDKKVATKSAVHAENPCVTVSEPSG